MQPPSVGLGHLGGKALHEPSVPPEAEEDRGLPEAVGSPTERSFDRVEWPSRGRLANIFERFPTPAGWILPHHLPLGATGIVIGKRTQTDVVVVGAGPAGLAVSACLNRLGLQPVLLERENMVAPSWRRHYDRLHLHTSRRFSSLPYRPMPRTYPRYPSRDQVVAYLQEYARAEGLSPRLQVEVRRLSRTPPHWLVETTGEAFRCDALVLATGATGVPRTPTWPGLETFPGPILHSSAYRNGGEFADRDVLVVGFGNSGGEIALDLVECGARPTVSVRSPVNVIPRDILGLPTLTLAVPLRKLPSPFADALTWPLLKACYPSYRRLALRKAAVGPFQQVHATGRVPLLDIGTIREIRRGRIEVRPDVVEVKDRTVRFRGNDCRTFDAIVFATGYEPSVPPGTPLPQNDDPPEASGLYFCGFRVPPTGVLREIGLEARRIADRIVQRVG